jgi:hypothetical protein
MAESPSKVTITNLTTNESKECQFNPKQFSLSKRVAWSQQDTKKKNVSNWSFGGGNPASMSVELFFDTTATGEDVRTKYTNFLLKLLNIDESKTDPDGKPLNEPPDCRFAWGSILTFVVVVESVDLTFTYFLSDGTPVRATARLSLKQKIDESQQSGQNPTSRSEARKTWIVREGETLDWIAFQEYGNPAHWRHIADTNDLANPRELRPGQVLKLVPLA